jgi:hypothetical protein
VTTSLRPDIIIYSLATKTIVWGELTSPLERNIPAAVIRKTKRYSNLDIELVLKGWKVHAHTLEVGAIGFLSQTVRHFLKVFQFSNSHLKRVLKRMAQAARRSTYYIWNARSSRSWDPPILSMQTKIALDLISRNPSLAPTLSVEPSLAPTPSVEPAPARSIPSVEPAPARSSSIAHDFLNQFNPLLSVNPVEHNAIPFSPINHSVEENKTVSTVVKIPCKDVTALQPSSSNEYPCDEDLDFIDPFVDPVDDIDPDLLMLEDHLVDQCIVSGSHLSALNHSPWNIPH